MGRRSLPARHSLLSLLAIREACRLAGTDRLPDCDLYVTLDPCTRRAAAISFARIRPEVYSGIRQAEASALLLSFFAERR